MPWEIIHFKIYKTQIPVIEQAIETAALMLGTDKWRGYCLEMICADFLAGANLGKEDPNGALAVHVTAFQVLARRPTASLSAGSDRKGFVNRILPKQPRLRLDPESDEQLRASSAARWLAMPMLREPIKPGGSPQAIPQPGRRRFRRESDHAVRRVSLVATSRISATAFRITRDSLTLACWTLKIEFRLTRRGNFIASSTVQPVSLTFSCFLTAYPWRRSSGG